MSNPVLERKLHRIWAQVSLDLGKALQRLDGQGRNALAVVERDRVDSLLAQQCGDLSPAAAPVEETAGPAAGEIGREGAVLEHLRARAEVGVEICHRGS